MIDKEITTTDDILSTHGNKLTLDTEYSSFKMNQMCRVCGEPAAGFHFGAFTCEGCKSFFGRTHSNLSQMSDCKNGGNCAINRKNRTSCKACRLRKCLTVGMSKSGSRYGRRSNWFKIHCLLQGQTEGGSSEHEHDGDEASSGRSVSSPDSIKSRHSPHDWKSSVSPDHINDRDEKPDLGKHHMAPFINPFFPNGSLLFHPGMLPMPPAYHMASRDSGMDLEQMQSDLVRWVVACQTQTGSGIVGQNGLPRMPYSPTLAERKVVRPQSPPMLVRKRPFSSVVELEQDQPLDLSAKRGKFYRDDQEDGSRGMSPKSSTSEDEPEDEQPDLREHFRLCNGRSTVLDLSRK